MKAAIVTAANSAYWRYLLVYISSLCTYNKEQIPLIVVDLGLKEYQRKALERIRFLDRIVTVDEPYEAWHDSVATQSAKVNIANQLAPGSYVKRQNWLKKLMIHTIEGYDWLIWNDADIIVSHDISLKDFIPSEEHPFTACLGRSFNLVQHVQNEDFAREIFEIYPDLERHHTNARNFNSGVFGFRPDYMRDLVEGPITDLAKRFPQETLGGFGKGNIVGDQSFLNIALTQTNTPITNLNRTMNARWIDGCRIRYEKHERRYMPRVYYPDGQPLKMLHYPGRKPGDTIPFGARPVQKLFRTWSRLKVNWISLLGVPYQLKKPGLKTRYSVFLSRFGRSRLLPRFSR